MNPVYVSLCQQVLYVVRSLARESTVMSRDTWETLLNFLLRINHAILAPATSAGETVTPSPLDYHLYHLFLLPLSPSLYEKISSAVFSRDVIDICKYYNVNCGIVSLDQEMAFDRVDHSYLFLCVMLLVLVTFFWLVLFTV